MAKVLYGNGISSIRGSIAGSTFSVNANGAYVRNRGTVANPNTSKQQTQRAILSWLSTLWKSISATQKEQWATAASIKSFVNSLGQSYHLTGFQLYMKVNAGLDVIGILPKTTPPADVVVLGVETVNLTLNVADFELSVTFTDTTTVVPAATTLLIEATPPMSLGVYRPKRPDFKKIQTVAALAPTTAINIQAAYASVYGIPPAGTKIFGRAGLVSNTSAQRGESVFDAFVMP